MALPEPSWFDLRITIGNVIESVVVITAGIGFVWHLRYKIILIALEIKYLRQETSTLAQGVKQIADVLTKVAVQDNRIDRAEQDIRDLQRGEGYRIPLRGNYEVGGTD